MNRGYSECYSRLLESDNSYSLVNARCGIAIIINNINYDPDSALPVRKSAENDHKKLESVFRMLNFQVETCLDLTADDMIDKMREVACNINYDHTYADCFACAILTHSGDEVVESQVSGDVLLGVDGRSVYTRDLLSPFRDETCPYLHGKPKLFFIEACREDDTEDIQDDGHQLTGENDPERAVSDSVEEKSGSRLVGDTAEVQTDGCDSANKSENITEVVCKLNALEINTEAVRKRVVFPAERRGRVVSPAPLYKDFLVLYATPPGYSSGWSKTGSQFASHMEEVFQEEQLKKLPLLTLLTRLCRRMALYVSTAPWIRQDLNTVDEHEKTPPLPCVMSMLTKDLYFKR